MREWTRPSKAFTEAMSHVRPKTVEFGPAKDMEAWELSRALRNSYGPETARKMEHAKMMADVADSIDDHEPFADRKRTGLGNAASNLLGFDTEKAPYFDGNEYAPYHERGEIPEYPPLKVTVPRDMPLSKRMSAFDDETDPHPETIGEARERFIERRERVREKYADPLVSRVDELTSDDEFDPCPQPTVGYDPDVAEYNDAAEQLREEIQQYAEHHEQIMTHEPEPRYNYLPPRYPDDHPIHRVEFDGRTYYFRQINDDGNVRLVRYELGDGRTLRRTDALDTDDLADPVLDALDANGVTLE